MCLRGLGPGVHGGRQRAPGITGRAPVVRDLGGDRRFRRARRLLAPTERFGDPRVELLALAREKLAARRLAHERVAEAVGPSIRLGNEQPVTHGLPQGR